MPDQLIEITSPGTSSIGPKHVAFDVEYAQQIQGATEGNTISTQFSNAIGGPWTTSRPIGGGGELEADPSQWTSQSTEDILPGVVAHASVWFRLGVWSSQGVEGEPLIVSQSIYRNVVTATPHGD